MWKNAIKRFGLFLLAIVAMIMALTGCNNDGNKVTDSSGQEKGKSPMYLEKELKAAITKDMTLDEMLDAFREVCQIPVEVEDEEDDILLFETGVYSFTGEDLFYFSVTRQFPDGSDEYYQLHLDVMYQVTPENKKLSSCSWSDEIEGDFFNYIRSTKDYNAIQEKAILKIDVHMDQT